MPVSAQYENLLEKPKDYFVIHHEIMLVLVLYEEITATAYKKRCFSFFLYKLNSLKQNVLIGTS